MKRTIRLLMTLPLFVAVHHAAAQVPFTLSSSPNIGSFVRSVTAADVNNDGKPDLISARGSASTLVIYTNSSGGIFVSNTAYAVGSFPYQVIAADVNGDGWPDLITANNFGNSLTVLANDGTGGFVLAATLDAGANSHPQSVAAADLNGDGKPDIITANNSAANINPVTVLTNDGAGGFAFCPTPNLLTGASWVIAVDVNGDGKVDLVCDTGKMTVMTNSGSGGFALSASYTVGTTPYAIVAADVNGDGQVDLITPNQGNNTLSVLTNNASGVFSLNNTLNVGSGPESLTAADVNGDGRVDLISGNWNAGTLTVMTNAATFLPRLTLKHSGNNLIVSWPAIWANWSLQQNASLDPGGWVSFGGAIGNDGTTKSATNSLPVANRFFRLSNP